jgi:hypothetical protein
MADMKIAENVEPLKKRDKLVKRNANGQFERGSKALAGAGRPPGSLNKTTTQLKEAILGVQLVFRREIVYPNGHVHIEGEIPLQLPAPASHTLPSELADSPDTSENKDLGA